MAIYELSTPAAQAAAEAALMDMLTQRASEQARAKAEDQSRQHNRQTPPDADNKGSQHARHAHESAEPQPMSKIEKATQLLLELSRDNAYAWLQGADPRDVVRVLNTAQALRDKAMSEGKEPPSDAKIYREYRRKSELYHDDPSNTIHRSVLMLDALMRGDLKHGTLPRL